MTRVSDIGERALIRRLTHHLQTHSDVIHGIGDDCAVVSAAPNSTEQLLLTTDAVTVGHHVTSDTPPALIGRKAIARTLSDIAAMGGVPRWALVDLVAPADADTRMLEALYAGIADVADTFGMSIVGGDTSEGDALSLHVFAVGTVPRDQALLRSGAHPGDALYVTGALGASGEGRHLTFTPRVTEGQWLREWATACMDISDGLAVDAHHIADASAVGLVIHAEHIPLSVPIQRLPAGDALRHAWADGEDYELLFTVPATRVAAFDAAWRNAELTPCTRIGDVTDQKGSVELLDANGTALEIGGGFEHF